MCHVLCVSVVWSVSGGAAGCGGPSPGGCDCEPTERTVEGGESREDSGPRQVVGLLHHAALRSETTYKYIYTCHTHGLYIYIYIYTFI